MTDKEDLDALKKKRKILRARVTRWGNELRTSVQTMAKAYRDNFMNNLIKARNDQEDLNEKIWALYEESGMPTEEMEHKISEDESSVSVIAEYCQWISFAESRQVQVDSNEGRANLTGEGDVRTSGLPVPRIRLPKASLPEFSDPEEQNFRKFIKDFEDVLGRHNLSNFEMFTYLKGQLTKGPRKLVESLDSENQSYDAAKELLTKAFDDPEATKHWLITRMSDLRFANYDDPYSFIGAMRSIISEAHSSELCVDDFLQYYIWRGLNPKLQDCIITITNKNKPSLRDIENNIFGATERYARMRANERDVDTGSKKGIYKELRDPVVSSAIDVKARVFCGLCKADGKTSDHELRCCTRYETSQVKVNKLKSLKGCIKCSFLTHETSNCRYQFASMCRFCEGRHMSFLCLKSDSRYKNPTNSKVNSVEVEKEPEDVTNELSLINVSKEEVDTIVSYSTDYKDDILLETFTADLVGTNSEVVPVRVFRDSGSQRNFITHHLASALCCDIIEENIPLNIKGFVAKKKIYTNIVRVPVKIRETIHYVPAICVDDINTSFRAKMLHDIAKTFEDRGYTMADKGLNRCQGSVRDIGMVLGAESRFVLPCTDVLFGGDKPSVYVETPLGVMLTGSINALRDNLERLLPNTQDAEVDRNTGSLSVNSINISTDGKEVYDNILSLEGGEPHEREISNILGVEDDSCTESNMCETDYLVTEKTLESMTFDESGRITVALPWNSRISHLLSTNYNLAHQILKTTLSKLGKDEKKLILYDSVISEQYKSGIIDRIDDVVTFRDQHPECSFLAHKGVFKMDKDTTKCRVVYLSTLAEKNRETGLAVNHNMALLSGPSLNSKIIEAFRWLRFDNYLLIFDICKAFLQISLSETDSNRLMFLWVRDVKGKDYSVVAYRCRRLPFGLRPSPFILMVVLWKILVLDTPLDDCDRELKLQIYNNIYMDNGSITSDSIEQLHLCYDKVIEIFGNYQFKLQQFWTNCSSLQCRVDKDYGCSASESVSVFGHRWDRVEGTIYPDKIILNKDACTKRDCLATLNSVYDLLGVYCPLLLRARLFVQELQTDREIGWDSPLCDARQREWVNICQQANATPLVKIPRHIGSKTDAYSVVVYTDASRVACGNVAYMYNESTTQTSFWGANSKILSENLKKKSIPCLELLGILWGLEFLFDIYDSLAGEKVVTPVQVRKLFICTDSACCLHWIEAAAYKFEKLNDKSIFVRNKLKLIEELCQRRPVKFMHAEGRINPADMTTRPCSYNLLKKSNFITGSTEHLHVVTSRSNSTDKFVVLPNPHTQTVCEGEDVIAMKGTSSSVSTNRAASSTIREVSDCMPKLTNIVEVANFSSFFHMVGVLKHVMLFANKLLHAAFDRGLKCAVRNCSVRSQTITSLIASEQENHYEDIFNYLLSGSDVVSNMPTLVGKLNLYVDSSGLLRVKGKFGKFGSTFHPILLPRSSRLTQMIVSQMHKVYSHCGAYQLLKELRVEFYVVGFFSLIKKVLKGCIICRRFNARTIKLNQNDYRLDRISPKPEPFAQIYLDYAGPFKTRLGNSVIKVWLLIITCMWSRAINIIICRSLETEDFLKSLQVHIYMYGIFSTCVSDLGSQLTSGASVIKTFLDDEDAKNFFQSHNVSPCTFSNYPKGNSALGSVVEVCVKQVKLLIRKTIKSVILDYFEFDHLIIKTNSIINKRPIGFKPLLSELASDELPDAITPEMLIKGYETRSLNVVPGLQHANLDDDDSPDFHPGEGSSLDKYKKLKEAKNRLVETYHKDFLNTMITQAIDKDGRYKRVNHEQLHVGDIVLLVEPNSKRYMYPMGRVEKVESNELGEVTAAYIFKGKSRETVYRHVSSVILLLSNPTVATEIEDQPEKEESTPRRLRSGRNY